MYQNYSRRGKNMRGLLVILVVLPIFSSVSLCQQPPADAVRDSVRSSPATENGELILDQIDIQGSIEKPGVIVLPSRVDPEMGEIELERSFDTEVKDGAEALPQPEEELGQVDGVKSIKKAVERQRN
jgi:hypothetical protein